MTDGHYIRRMADDQLGYFERNKSRLTMTVSGSLARSHARAADGQIRRAQLGAAFAVVSHFTVHSEPALVSMPTGSGKSAVMTLLSFLLGARRVLVVTPSKLLREQLAEEFTFLRVLRARGVFPTDVPGPRVAKAEHRLADEAAWVALTKYDVVVATPNVTSPANAGVVGPPEGMFDVVLVDEGHHGAAPTWRALIECTHDASVVLFTATPFRRDRHQIPAELVYSYPLQQALDDGVLAPIDFQPVDVPETVSDAERDQALAEQAATLLRAPEHQSANSRIIARTNVVKHAESLVETYGRLGVPMGLITASTPPPRTARILRELRAGDLAGLVSVGVLGEGFDFPTLKIGVYHHRHASLPATLQFLGRITRLVPDGPKAVLLALREEVTDETRELYASDTAWAELVPALADAAVESEAERRRFVRGFTPPPDRSLSISAIRPRKDFLVFEVEQDSVDLRTPMESLGDGDVIYQGVDQGERVAVIVTEHPYRPEWMAADTLDGFVYELHVVVKDQTGRFLFVHGPRDKTIRDLVREMGESAPKLIGPVWLDRLMGAVALYRYFSVGMRSARAAGKRLAAYRMLAGTDVGGAVLPSETRSYGTGHVIAQVYDPMTVDAETLAQSTVRPQQTTSIGVSYGRGKVFSPDASHLLDYRKWCDRMVELAERRKGNDPTGLPNLNLLSPRTIEKFPHHPYLAVLEWTALGSGAVVTSAAEGICRPIGEFGLDVVRLGDDELELVWCPEETPAWRGIVRTDGSVETRCGEAVVQDSLMGTMPLAEFLTDKPPTVFYADGSSSMGRVLFQPKAEYDDLDPRSVSAWAFSGVDIRKEADPPAAGKVNIITHVVGEFAGRAEVEFVVVDDRAHEIADVLVIEKANGSGRRAITLVHCKFSSKDFPGARVEDLYEVLGQAGRSVTWLDLSAFAARLLNRLGTGSEVAAGDKDELVARLTEWTASPAPARWSIAVCQPGLLASAVSSRNVKIMLTDVHEWIAQHDAVFQVIAHR